MATDNIELLKQNLLMEHGNADRALAAACRIINEAEGYIDHYRDKCSYGYIRRLPRKPYSPLVLDSFAPLELAEEKSPGLAEGR